MQDNIKPGTLVRIGSVIGLVIGPAPHMEGYPDVDWVYVLINDDIIPCLQSHMEVIRDAQ